MDILEEKKRVRALEHEYLKHKYIANNQNSLESIRTFGDWHSAASVLFTLAHLDNDTNFRKFQDENTGGNAYVLANTYDVIHSSYEILMAKVENKSNEIDKNNYDNCPQIFISHSSKDKLFVKTFVDDFLKKGLSLSDHDIACTSFEATGVTPGENIPLYIKHNIKGAKICICMVSKNYKSSEVCMNEVGAAWALDKPPIQIVLPNTDFSELGWLLNTDKAAKIDDEDSLDNLMETICERIGIPVVSPKHWNPCKRDLLNSMKQLLEIQEDNSDIPFLQFTNGLIENTINPIYLMKTYGKPSIQKNNYERDPFYYVLPQITNHALCPIEIELVNNGKALEGVFVKIEANNVHFEAGNLESPKIIQTVLQKYSIEDTLCEFELGVCNAKINKRLDRFYIKSTEITGIGYECDCLHNLETRKIVLNYTISTKEKPYYGQLFLNITPKVVREYSLDESLRGKFLIEEYKKNS